MPTFGDRFQGVLRERELTQAAAAALLDTTQSVVSYYAHLKRPPKRGTLLNIAEKLGVDPSALTGEKKPAKSASAGKCDPSDLAPLKAMRALKRRWKAKPKERDSIRHLVALLFPTKADQVIAWLEER